MKITAISNAGSIWGMVIGQLCNFVVGSAGYSATSSMATTGGLSQTNWPSSAISPEVVSGSFNDRRWTARSLVVGTRSTGTPGDPIYHASMPQYSGVASLIINTPTGSFFCSGSLLPDRRSLLTAAHCITDTSGNLDANSATAYFYDGSPGSYNPNTFVPFNSSAVARNVSDFFPAPNYSGGVIEDDDLAVVRLDSEAPAFATSYQLSTATSLASQQFTVAGYGQRSSAGGSVGRNLGVGILRQGNNRYDYAWGDPNFGNFFGGFSGFTQGLNTWVADFDSGQAGNDAACLIAQEVNTTLAGDPRYCNLGVGPLEVALAGGDSGGPGFINGEIATVSSYGLTFLGDFGDSLAGLNSSFGEFSGYVPVSLHRSFIESVLVNNNPQSVPAPMPVVAAATMFGWSRRLRKRLASSR